MAPSAFAAGTTTVTAASPVPNVLAGQTKQAGSDLTIALTNQFKAGDTITYTVAPATGQTNCQASNINIGFASTPTVKVTAATGNSSTDTAPSVTAALSTVTGETACSSTGVKDVLTLTIGNFSTGITTDSYTITVSGVSYNLGSGDSPGSITATVGGSVNGSTPTAGSPVADATIATAGATANSPTVALAPSTTASSAISNVVITESVAGAVPAGTDNYVCITLNGTTPAAAFDTTAKPTVAATGGGTATTPANVSATQISFPVTKVSSSAGTYTVSGIKVTPGSTLGPVTATVIDGASSSCGTVTGTTNTLSSNLTLFAVLNSSRTYGQDAPATAAAQLESAFPYSGVGAKCTANGTVVLARYDLFPDALSGSYAAGRLGTGILLTNTSTLSSAAVTAMRLEGVTTVYVMGGPLAVSDAVVNQIKATQAYDCGGSTPLTDPFTHTPVTINVIRLAGTDRYGTSEATATYFGSGGIGQPSFSAAYGMTAYNGTSGNASTSAPATAGNTAIVTTGENFRDAVSASVLADAGAGAGPLPMILTTPTALSSEAATALTNDKITQVIVMGGPLAISNGVVTSIEGMNISVLRIAGQDGTDTAQRLAQFELNNHKNAAGALDEGLGWASNDTGGGNNVALARGDFYPDALAGSALAANITNDLTPASHNAHPEPILLTEGTDSLGTYTTSFLNTGGEVFTSTANGIDNMNTSATVHDGQVFGIDVFGGPLAVTPATVTAALGAVSQG